MNTNTFRLNSSLQLVMDNNWEIAEDFHVCSCFLLLTISRWRRLKFSRNVLVFNLWSKILCSFSYFSSSFNQSGLSINLSRIQSYLSSFFIGKTSSFPSKIRVSITETRVHVSTYARSPVTRKSQGCEHAILSSLQRPVRRRETEIESGAPQWVTGSH